MKLNKPFIFILLIIICFPIFSQNIYIDYSKINSILPDEDFTVIGIIKKGLEAIDNIYLILVNIESNEKKRFLMNIEKNIADITIYNDSLFKEDFYYYFEIVLQNNEIIYLPSNTKERFNNTVKIIKKKERPYTILLSPDNRENATRDFIISLYIDPKIQPAKIIFNGKDIGFKMKKGQNIFTYIPDKDELGDINKLSIYSKNLLIKDYIIVIRDNIMPYFVKGNINAIYNQVFANNDSLVYNNTVYNTYILKGNIISYSEYFLFGLRFNIIGEQLPRFLNTYIYLNINSFDFGIGDFLFNEQYVNINSYNIRGLSINYNKKTFSISFLNGMFFNDNYYNYLSYSKNYTSILSIDKKSKYIDIGSYGILSIINEDSVYFNNLLTNLKTRIDLREFINLQFEFSATMGIRGNNQYNLKDAYNLNSLNTDSISNSMLYTANVKYYYKNNFILLYAKSIKPNFYNAIDRNIVYYNYMFGAKKNIYLLNKKMNMLIKYDYKTDSVFFRNESYYGIFLNYIDRDIVNISTLFTHRIRNDSTYYNNILTFKGNIGGNILINYLPVDWHCFIMQRTLNTTLNSIDMNILTYGGDILFYWNDYIKTQFLLSFINYSTYISMDNKYNIEGNIYIAANSFINIVMGIRYFYINENQKYGIYTNVSILYKNINIKPYLNINLLNKKNTYYNRFNVGINVKWDI